MKIVENRRRGSLALGSFISPLLGRTMKIREDLVERDKDEFFSCMNCINYFKNDICDIYCTFMVLASPLPG